MSLPPSDAAYLANRELVYEVAHDQGMTCIIFPAWRLPAGYDRDTSDLLLRLSPGYPDVPPDMWWFEPPVERADRQPIPATDSREAYFDRVWQRWSRHFEAGQWRSGVDGLESFVALINSELSRCGLGSVA